MTPDSSRTPLDPVNNPRQPFGLPAGTVRGFLSLLICAFFWMVLLWPSDAVAKPLLGHFFMLALVLMAFASSPSAHSGYRDTSLTPWLMRMLFVGGSIAVVAFTLVKDPAQFSQRLTPDVVEFRDWWGTFLAVTAGGFAFGLGACCFFCEGTAFECMSTSIVRARMPSISRCDFPCRMRC